MSLTASKPSAEPEIDCMTCSPAERYQRPNRGHITIKDEDTGAELRVCGGCLEAGVDLAHLAAAAPTPSTGELGDPSPAPAGAAP